MLGTFFRYTVDNLSLSKKVLSLQLEKLKRTLTDVTWFLLRGEEKKLTYNLANRYCHAILSFQSTELTNAKSGHFVAFLFSFLGYAEVDFKMTFD